jgi:hypothetical protein
MKIGKLKRSYTIEPLQDPVPAATPPVPAKTAVSRAVEDQPTRP